MADEETTQANGSEQAPDAESRAKLMGWAPKDQWRGAPEEWIDADAFIERGESIMPILRANNRKLEDKVKTLEQQNLQTQQLLREANTTLTALKDANTEIARERARAKKTQLASAVRDAREEGNVEKETELQAELTDLTAELRQAELENGKEQVRQKPIQTQDFTQEPWFKEWHQDNPWFGQDQDRTEYAAFVAQRLARSSPELRHGAFLEKVREDVEKVLGPTQERRQSRVEGGRQQATGNGGGKSFSDLPGEAKKACERQAGRLVGKGKAFENMDTWRKHYAEQYFSE